MENRLETWVRLSKSFEHEAFQDELEGLRDRLKLGLLEHTPEDGETVAELEEQIKALRVSVTVEAAPVRVGTRKAARAERLVTARIRERTVAVEAPAKVEPQAKEAKSEAEPAAQVIPLPLARPAEEVAGDDKPSTSEGVAGIVMPAMYQERGHAGRVTRRRKGDGPQLQPL